jgi:phosphomethylpyrimidine synthase
VPGARRRDDAMARARAALDWEAQFQYALDPERARKVRKSRLPSNSEVCTMCGELCAIKILKNHK